MCGRFTLLTDLDDIIDAFGIQEVECEYSVGNNMSPGQYIPAIILDNKIKLVCFRWGLIPPWAKDPSIGNKMINARAETVTVKPSFRDAFKRGRCLIIADGFYEWSKSDRKNPYHFSLISGRPFAFAGLYETWRSPENAVIKTCAIITTDANDLVKPIHERMPVIVPEDKEMLWINPGTPDIRALCALLKPYPAAEMKMAEGFIPRTIKP